jgi:hypothetical protein
MSADYLPTITAFADAWEAALALLWQRVNAFLAKHSCTARLPVSPVPAALNLSGALGKLRVAARELRRFSDDVPEDFLRLFVGESPWTIPHAGEADYQLQCLADMSAKAGIADPWTCNIVEPNIKHAEAIRASLVSEQKRALQESLSDPERKALRAMFVLKAFTQESRQTITAIAQQAEKKQWASAGPYRNALPCLVDKTLAKTKEGRGGGAWLTPDGRKIAKAIRLK